MAQTKDFLLEIGVEEMPSAPLNNAVSQMSKLVAKGLDEAGLAHGVVRIISSPRRLAALVANVSCATEEIHETKRGPKAQIAFDADGNPTKAAQGFARKCGVAPEGLVRREEAGVEYVFADIDVPARPALPLLSELSTRVIEGLEWPNYRSQRWGSTHEAFVRPVRWLCVMLGEEVVPVRYADVESGNLTRGHRVLGPGEHVVPEPALYADVLRSACVLPAEERATAIREGISRVESELSVHVDTPRKTFDEVVNLCEWPSVLVGRFDEEFLAVPHEIICESMLSNQRYFPCYDTDGALTRYFIVVSNGAPEAAETIVDGNERVVRARLDDAKFFYEEDLKHPLEDYLSKLAKVTFQEQLGTVLQKSERMERIAAAAAAQLGCDDAGAAEAVQAAHLAKADLVTQAVVEFTSQQGVMGGYYAKAQGLPVAVCEAIRDQYRPRFAGDELPTGSVGRAVAVADKLDTICGMFAIEQPPTGSSDPFAVRRSAIGVIALLRQAPACDLRALIECSLGAYEAQGLSFDRDKTAVGVLGFFRGRLAAIAKDEGAEPDVIEAVSAVGIVDPGTFLSRVEKLGAARAGASDTFSDLAGAYARAAHLADEELGLDTDEALVGDQERALLEAVSEAVRQKDAALESGDFDAALVALASLREPIDRFFTEVLVMDENEAVRTNRLRLLNRFVDAFGDVADFSALSKGTN